MKCKFRVGDPCSVKVFSTKSEKSPKWVPAVITKVFGARSSNVIKVCPSGPARTRHVEQLQPRISGDSADLGLALEPDLKDGLKLLIYISKCLQLSTSRSS
ncbi:hypothetical protein RRG08_047852 [Elysia crispata]|uniref:Uncharacterized protein n=1 Tax=Elysia crispata TaxID=231223 RepID=A0AAE0ZXS0_9GAST|nr:hypothetical protein RRG08_047852 [Elysia crispata]